VGWGDFTAFALHDAPAVTSSQQLPMPDVSVVSSAVSTMLHNRDHQPTVSLDSFLCHTLQATTLTPIGHHDRTDSYTEVRPGSSCPMPHMLSCLVPGSYEAPCPLLAVCSLCGWFVVSGSSSEDSHDHGTHPIPLDYRYHRCLGEQTVNESAQAHQLETSDPAIQALQQKKEETETARAHRDAEAAAVVAEAQHAESVVLAETAAQVAKEEESAAECERRNAAEMARAALDAQEAHDVAAGHDDQLQKEATQIGIMHADEAQAALTLLSEASQAEFAAQKMWARVRNARHPPWSLQLGRAW
jgi:hypothetical protein